VGAIDHEHEAILVERCAQDVRVLEGANEPERRLLSEHELEYLLGMTGAHADGDARVALGEALEQRREDVGRDCRRSSDDEAPGPTSFEGIHLHAPVGERLERSDGVRKEGAARVREAHPSGSANEELRAQIRLERLDPRGQRRLRDEESLSCSAYALPLGRLDERRDLVQEHL
jgi:hypothetical protein